MVTSGGRVKHTVVRINVSNWEECSDLLPLFNWGHIRKVVEQVQLYRARKEHGSGGRKSGVKSVEMSRKHWDQARWFLKALGKDVLHRKGRARPRKVGLDVPALPGHTACSSDTYKWQLQIQAVAIAPLLVSGGCRAYLGLYLEAASKVWHYITEKIRAAQSWEIQHWIPSLLWIYRAI